MTESAQAALVATAQNTSDSWQARLHLDFKAAVHKTVLSGIRRAGPLSVQRAFYPEGNVCHIYLLHPPGGVVGGDRLDININVQSQSHALLTTPGATKFYRSQGGTAVLKQHFTVADDAVFEWLPQENIFFPGARLNSELTLNLAARAKAAVWEIQCLGRPVINEVFSSGILDSHWKILRDGKPVFIERLQVDKDSLNVLSNLAGNPVTGTFLITGATRSLLESAREVSAADPCESLAMTLIDDLLVVRYLGGSTETARNCFTRIWQHTRESCMGKSAMLPRIWNT